MTILLFTTMMGMLGIVLGLVVISAKQKQIEYRNKLLGDMMERLDRVASAPRKSDLRLFIGSAETDSAPAHQSHSDYRSPPRRCPTCGHAIEPES